MHGGGGRLAVVDRRDLAARRADDHEPAAADAAREGLDDAEHGRRDDRGVDGVRPVTQRLDGRLRGEQVDRGGCASGPFGGRCLLRRRLRDAGRRKRQQPPRQRAERWTGGSRNVAPSLPLDRPHREPRS